MNEETESTIAKSIGMNDFKFRVWWNKQMIYPKSTNKPCDWFIDQNGRLLSFPNKLDETFDPVRFYEAYYMFFTGWKGERYDLYQGDIVRDYDDYIGLIVWERKQGWWGIQYKDDILPLAEFPKEGALVSLGNIHQHPDWENWDSDQEREVR